MSEKWTDKQLEAFAIDWLVPLSKSPEFTSPGRAFEAGELLTVLSEPPRDSEDIEAMLNWASDAGLLIRPKGGGYSFTAETMKKLDKYRTA